MNIDFWVDALENFIAWGGVSADMSSGFGDLLEALSDLNKATDADD